jgi:hypothetical protein
MLTFPLSNVLTPVNGVVTGVGTTVRSSDGVGDVLCGAEAVVEVGTGTGATDG